ncbi:hypothetical protein N1032_27010, partial [Herbiconiux sp. CPCC 203386]|nr:hypothetical protein [Herbiconiux daphne]
DKEKLGALSHAFHFFEEEGKDPLWVFNLYGQYHFDNKSEEYGTRYWALAKALEKMRVVLSTRRTLYWPSDKVLKIGFPLIGCGLAGGYWDIVEELIKYAFRDTPWVEVYIYTLDYLEGKNYVEIEST